MKNNNYLKKFIEPGFFSTFILLGLSIFILVCSKVETSINFTGSETFITQLIHFQFFSSPPILASIFYFISLLIILYLMFYINERHGIIKIRSVLPLLFLLLLSLPFTEIRYNAGLLAGVFLILSLDTFFASYQTHIPVKKIFDTFFLLSASSFFLTETLLIIPIFWLFFFQFRIAHIRVFLASIIGLITPYIFMLSIIAYTQEWDYFLKSFEGLYHLQISLENIKAYQKIYAGFILLLFIMHVIYFRLQKSQEKVKTRIQISFLQSICIALLLLLFIRSTEFNYLYTLFIIILSFLLGHYFSLRNSKVHSILFFLFFLSSILLCFF